MRQAFKKHSKQSEKNIEKVKIEQLRRIELLEKENKSLRSKLNAAPKNLALSQSSKKQPSLQPPKGSQATEETSSLNKQATLASSTKKRQM